MITKKMRSLVTDFASMVSHQPDKVAMVDGNGRSMTYLALSRHIKHAQAWLQSLGMQPGDTMIALMPNAMETIILFLACLHGGYTYAPLPCTATMPEIMRWKALTRARWCVMAKTLSSHYQAEVKTLDWQVAALAVGEKDMPWQAAEEVNAVGGGRLVMGSSGSTGEPKAMLLDGDRLWSAGHAFLRYHQIDSGDIRFWNYLPMSYLGGLFNLALIPFAAGGSIYVDDAFNGKTFLVFWATVKQFHINCLWLVPTILRGLLTLSNRIGQAVERPKIDYCFLGTAPVSLEEKQRFSQVFGVEPLENYGLSETTFISSERKQQAALRRQGSVGFVMPDVDVKFVPVEDGDTQAAEIRVKTPYAMLGYLNAQGTLDQAVDAEGYLSTGDCGQLIDNQLQLTGRRRDIIKKGGVLVVLREIEILAESYADVAEATAVKIDHSFYGESCVLYVRTKQPAADADQFIAGLEKWLHDQLVRHKWPEKIIHCDDFPRTMSGKVMKHILSARSAVHAK